MNGSCRGDQTSGRLRLGLCLGPAGPAPTAGIRGTKDESTAVAVLKRIGTAACPGIVRYACYIRSVRQPGERRKGRGQQLTEPIGDHAGRVS
jgi:hypothetical protein